MIAARDRLAGFARDLETYRDDPVAFCENVLDFDPHEGQARWLLGSAQDENLLVTGNRWGKSWVAAAKRIWKCAYRRGWDKQRVEQMKRTRQTYQSINIAPTADQSQLVFWKAHAMLQGPRASWLVKEIKLTPFPAIVFVNDAVFQARSTAGDGRHLLGHVFDDANWDEAAQETRFEQILDNVLRMRLVDRAGKLDYTSTGNGRNPFGQLFLETLEGKHPDIYAQPGTSRDNPYIDQASLTKVAAKMSDKMRQQNYEGLIVEGGGVFFNLADLSACEDTMLNEHASFQRDEEGEISHFEVRASPGKRWWEQYPSHRYLHGWDLADKQDRTVGYTVDLSTTPMTVVEFERFRRRGWDHVYDRIRARHRRYRTSKATKIDSTGVGDVVENELKDIGCEGVTFGGAGKKDALLTNLQSALSLREIKMPLIQVAHNEFAFYEREDENLDTDCVMGLAVAMWFAKRYVKPWHVESVGDEALRAARSGTDDPAVALANFYDVQIAGERAGQNRPEVIEQYQREKQRRSESRPA